MACGANHGTRYREFIVIVPEPWPYILVLLGFKLFGVSLSYTREYNMGLDAASLFNVNGMVAIITGGSSGIGVTWAHALDQNGAAKVFILGRRENKLKEVAAAAVRIPLLALPETHFSLTLLREPFHFVI